MVPTRQATAWQWAMAASTFPTSPRSQMSASGSLPIGWFAAVLGRTWGVTSMPLLRCSGTRTVPTAPVAPATRTRIGGTYLDCASVPEPFPPVLARRDGVGSHALADEIGAPTSELRERGALVAAAVGDGLLVSVGGLAAHLAAERVAHHVTAL